MGIRCAQVEDISRVKQFLEEASLSSDGVQTSIDYFLIMENELGDIKATLGIEPHGDVGLLRSLAIRPEANEKDLLILFKQIFILAKERELKSLYLASNKKNSLDFFRLMGFVEEEEVNLPEALFESVHVNHILSVDNSFFLKVSI